MKTFANFLFRNGKAFDGFKASEIKTGNMSPVRGGGGLQGGMGVAAFNFQIGGPRSLWVAFQFFGSDVFSGSRSRE